MYMFKALHISLPLQPARERTIFLKRNTINRNVLIGKWYSTKLISRLISKYFVLSVETIGPCVFVCQRLQTQVQVIYYAFTKTLESSCNLIRQVTRTGTRFGRRVSIIIVVILVRVVGLVVSLRRVS